MDKYLKEMNQMLANERENNQAVSEDQMMTGQQVASFLNVGIGTVRRWTRYGKLKGYKVGGRGDWRYFREDVLTFLHGEN